MLLLLVTTAGQAKPTILVVGDSLSAAYGLSEQQGWVALLDKQLQQQGYRYDVVNASVSGETSDGGLQRFSAIIKRHQPKIVILELGANDGLRGLPLNRLYRNLKQMITEAQSAQASVLLIGMRLPPNYGPQYTRQFADTFHQLSEEERTALVPFLFEKIATNINYFQSDRLHPTAEAQPLLLETVWRELEPLL